MIDRITTINPNDLKIVNTPRTGQTLEGYGSRLPTSYMIRVNGYWRAVKAICFSNCASFYIKDANGGKIFINESALEVNP